MPVPALAARGLSKQYGTITAVNQLDLEVAPGQVFGFLGPNGAGKTTSIRIALGLVRPSAGRIEVLGELVGPSNRDVLTRVGALVETPALYPYLTGRDNLRVFARLLGNLPESRLDEVLDVVGLRGREGHRVSTYSLGMKQRLGLAIAMLNDPDLYILDEPANGLDPAGIVEMRDLLRGLAAAGRTVFLSSHVLNEVQQICDRVAIIAAGKLVREARVADLLAENGEYEVVTERADNALRLVLEQPWGQGARVEGSKLICATPGRGSDLLRFLASRDIWPESFSPRQLGLEEVFLSLTGEAVS